MSDDPLYDMIAIDLDGTLLDRAGTISDANCQAVDRARSAGLTITICTGRGLMECAPYLERLDQRDTVIVAGGSILACPQTRSTVHRFAIESDLVADAVNRLIDYGFPVMVLKDPVQAGYDYLMVVGEQEHPLDPVTEWWFQKMEVSVRFVRTLDEDDHPEHTVRLGVCGHMDDLAPIKQDLAAMLGEQATIHHFPAVVADEHVRTLGQGNMHILEIFSKKANKWSAISWLAEQAKIDPRRIAAIGDEINDLSMIRGAGLGVAMGNAVDEVKEAADQQTFDNENSGVAHAITQILDGEW